MHEGACVSYLISLSLSLMRTHIHTHTHTFYIDLLLEIITSTTETERKASQTNASIDLLENFLSFVTAGERGIGVLLDYTGSTLTPGMYLSAGCGYKKKCIESVVMWFVLMGAHPFAHHGKKDDVKNCVISCRMYSGVPRTG